MAYKYHGGECCGIRHISYDGHVLNTRLLGEINCDICDAKNSFVEYYNEEHADWDDYEENYSEGGIGVEDASFMIELVLADYQFTHPESYDCLQKLYKDGWKLVNSFINTNTDNKVYVFHLNTIDNGEIKDPLELAKKWKRDG